MVYIKTALQIGLLCAIAWSGAIVSKHWELGIPGNILGILFLFLVLELKIIPLDWIEPGANLLITELVLFFIPSAVAIVQFEPLMKQSGLAFFLVIGLSTLGVMIVVGIITEKMIHYRKRR
jgi:holin-like protein